MSRAHSLRTALLLASLGTLLPAVPFAPTRPAYAADAQPGARLPSDESRAAFRLRRLVTIGDDRGGATFGSIALPPEINSGGEPPWRDLRLSRLPDGGGDPTEVPYVVEEQRAAIAAARFTGTLLDTRTEYHPLTDHNMWLVDLGRSVTFERIDLDIPERDFARRFKFEIADQKGGPFRLLQDDVGVFDKPWDRPARFRIHHTHLSLDRAVKARFIRITSDPVRFPPAVTVTGVTVSRREAVPGTTWSRPAPIEGLTPPAEEGAPTGKKAHGAPAWPALSRYRLQLPPGLPIEQVTIAADDPAFARLVRIVEERPSDPNTAGTSSKIEPVTLGEGVLFRIVGTPRKNRPLASDFEVGGENLTLPLSAHPGTGSLFVEIDGTQGPPLSNLRVTVSGVGARLIFPLLPSDGRFALYYAAPTVRAPSYDLEELKPALTQLELSLARLGDEEKNPAYRVVPPLSFVRTNGAPLDASQFRLQRTLSLPGDGKPDIYGVSLAAEDIAVMATSLGDVRIVDAEDHQVPYVLDRSSSEGRVALDRADQSKDGKLSVIQLRYSPSGQPLSLPYDALELEFSDAFFNRPARLILPGGEGDPNGGARRSDRVLWSGTLSRQPSEQGGEGPSIHRIPVGSALAGERIARLRLEIDNGDNPPLALKRALGVLMLPRLAFKLDASAKYRLLLAAPSVDAPRYDIESLRRDLLDYSAIPAVLGAIAANPQYRARTADYLREAPPTAILWGALLLAVLALVGMTFKLIRKPDETA